MEQLVAPIRAANLPMSSTQDEVRWKIMHLLSQIETVPLRSRDVQLIREAVAAAMRTFHLEDDRKLTLLIDRRFSFEYIPAISKLNIEKPVKAPLETDEVEVDLVKEDPKLPRESIRAESGDKTANLDALKVLSDRKVYYLCSVRRNQSALWTTYHMCLDGVREFEPNGNLSAPAMNEAPIPLLGARKFKSGPSAQALIWNQPDVKQWKDKNAVGRVSRQASAVYYGVPFAEQPDHGLSLSASAASLDTVGGSDCHTTPSQSPRSNSVGIALESLATTLMSADEPPAAPPVAPTAPVAPLSATNRSASTVRWSFRSATTAPLLPPTVTGITTSLSEGSIALALSSTGMDNLLQLCGVSVRKATTTTRSASHVALDTVVDTNGNGQAGASHPSKGTAAAFTEPLLLEKLDALSRKETSPGDFLNPGLLLLRSRLPRKVPSVNGRATYTLPFGDVSRVRTTSRKNLVIDAVTASSDAEEAESAAEWTENRSKPALLQVITTVCLFCHRLSTDHLTCTLSLSCVHAAAFRCYSSGSWTRTTSFWTSTTSPPSRFGDRSHPQPLC